MPDSNLIALPVGTTLDRFIARNQDSFPHATGELSQLLRDIALAAKIVNREIVRAGLTDITGNASSVNIQGEEQQKLDVIADIRFTRSLINGGQVAAIVSEEKEEIIDTGNYEAKYVVAIDPLDGSSNIDVNVPVGTIFSIYKRITAPGTKATNKDFLQGGHKQVAAGYVLYGASMVLVYTTGKGVNGFTYEYTLGDFILSHKEIKMPLSGKIYSCNEGYSNDFPDSITQFINQCKHKNYIARYAGSLVCDIHRNLFKGGIYLYPVTQKSPAGKLRLLYECYPIAFIIEQANGRATNGATDILKVACTAIHERSSFFAGAVNMMKELIELTKEEIN
jgi:fructose-1,6-bisphosphatase I